MYQDGIKKGDDNKRLLREIDIIETKYNDLEESHGKLVK
jgi:hypothetical protein